MGFARMHPALFLNLATAGDDVRFDPPGRLSGIAELAAGLMSSGADYMPDLPGLTADMGKIFYFARIFEKLLRAQRPRALILSVYYHPVGMAWMLACRWAGVTSVDLQHGRLGPVHGLYTHLSAAPPDGYHLAPDVIWSWGQQTRAAIETTLNPGCTRHHAVVGGNPWLHKWRSGNAAAFEPPGLTAFLDETRGRPKILVSGQPHGNPLTPMMIETIKRCPATWVWLFRLHPLRRHTAPQIAASLKAAGIDNAELDRATQFPLFTLLGYADHHVTAFSSVALEAAAFGLSTSLTAPEGEAAFRPEIAQGIARYTPDSASLGAHLHEVLSGQRPKVYSDFMDMSDGVVDRAIEMVLQ
jgi:hypothetical protein